MSDAYRLSFLLPASMILLVPEGRHQPCLAGCVLIVKRGQITIEGPSRDRVFDQARRFFRVHARKLPPLTIVATLNSPSGYVPRGRDGWSIVINSDVTFAPTTIHPNISATAPLQLVESEEPRQTIMSAG